MQIDPVLSSSFGKQVGFELLAGHAGLEQRRRHLLNSTASTEPLQD
jgi:hypothetical protein